ncbi:MAG TPA: hypothetical protein VGL13_12915 [Polyangiaceae bacterium]|jgi:hypothetical protein
MTSSDMNRLALLFSEVERRLESGETSSPELDKLFVEITQLRAGEDVWFNFDPKGITDFALVNSERTRSQAAPNSQSSAR